MLNPRLAPVKFLLVDDLDENSFTWSQILARDGLELVTARSVPLALEALLVHDFALVIIDVRMPESDGVELAELMRGSERTCRVPIILVTAGTLERQGLFRGYEAGAVDFLDKPIEPTVLRNKADTFYDLYRLEQRLAHQLQLLAAQQTELERANQALLRSREVADAANRAKDEFLANVSHEIRTPMNAILGLTDLVLETTLADGQRQSLETVRSAAGNLLGTINDLLDFAKIEAGQLELDAAPFLLRDALRDTLHALAMRAHTKGLDLVCAIDPLLPDQMIGDGGRLRQILIHLVGNAIKFTESGEVVIGILARREGRRLPGARIEFFVRDTGIGIPSDKQDAILRAFEQEDTSTTRRYGGTGLGLTIAARLIAQMGGKLSVESARGSGSTFRFTVDFASPSAGAPRPPSTADTLAGVGVLVVGGQATSRRVLETWLRAWKAHPTLVSDLVAVRELFASGSPPEGRPDVIIIVDGQASSADAVELARAWSRTDGLEPPRIVALTTGGVPSDLARCRADASLSKPVLDDELRETITRLLDGAEQNTESRNDQSPDSQAGRAAPAPLRLRIVVAEDNDFNVQLMSALLSKRGHDVRVAKTGAEALRLIELGGCDLLLLDVHMPVLDGFQVIQAIRGQEHTQGGHLPVVAVTARSRKEDRDRCLEAGMDDYLAKPICATSLWAAIERLVPSAESSLDEDATVTNT
jgi:two-component system sensor histidine kinase/response regulator